MVFGTRAETPKVNERQARLNVSSCRLLRFPLLPYLLPCLPLPFCFLLSLTFPLYLSLSTVFFCFYYLLLDYKVVG